MLITMLSGCAVNQTYEGPKLSNDKVATIEAFRSYYHWMLLPQHESFYLVKSNDLLVGGDPLWAYPKYIEVLPGKTKIKLLYFTNLFAKIKETEKIEGTVSVPLPDGSASYVQYAPVQQAYVELEFNTEAGKSYKIMFYPNFLSKKNTVPKPWVVDLHSKEVVFGAAPVFLNDPTFIP